VSNDSKLQKVILDPDVIDLSFGEPVVVAQSLFRQLNRFGDPFKMPNIHDLPKWTYQPAAGKPDLVKVLEDKYGSRVAVCNGAKQALAASIYAFKKTGIKSCFFESPYYPANPSIIESIGVAWSDPRFADSFLITSPNNPCGRNLSNVDIDRWGSKGPMIHDAAYYTEIYLPEDQKPVALGNIQVFSMSKMYGLSGLRIGYAVVRDERYYQHVVDYIETTTAGVSTASQDIARNVELFFKDNPKYLVEFHKEARAAISESRKLLTLLDSDVLQPEPCESNSMFAWCRVGSRLNNKAAKVHILPGELFGKPGYMRLNIAHPSNVIREAIDRLNNNKN
jgi:aspartate/methionine/tyrosine aminotransferase